MVVVAMRVWPSRICTTRISTPFSISRCRVRVPQGMRCHPVAKTRRVSSGGEGVRQHTLVERAVPAPVGEHPARIAMGPPYNAQFVEKRLRQQHQPLLVALANDT